MKIGIQRALIWMGLAFMTIFAICLGFLLHMIPPPDANLTPDQVAAFYQENSFSIRLGAVITSWFSAFALPLAVAITAQMWRLEKGIPVWSLLQLVGGVMMSMFLVFPPLLWGVAAFTPERMPEVTALMHELACLTLVTTDQYFIFQMIPIIYFAFTCKDAMSPFPRWIGYLSIWATIVFEVGAFAFMQKTGPFSWNGLFVYWLPLCAYGIWMTPLAFSVLNALKKQEQAEAEAASRGEML